jgi:hypothetical protein
MRITVPGVRSFVLVTAFLSFSLISFSQSITTGNGKYEFGLGVGPLFFLGDLGGNQGEGKTFIKDVNLPLTKMAKGLYLNVYPAEWFGMRLAANHGKLEGDDSKIEDKGTGEVYRKIRNLKFRSTLLEAYAAVEVYPTVFMERYDGLQGKLRPYGVVGFGMFKYNPQSEYIDPSGSAEWVDLRPLRLEGQGMSEYPDKRAYKWTSMEIPMGFGFKYFIKENMYVGLEILHRKTFTDYIDDVSTTYIDPVYFSQYLAPEDVEKANYLHNRQNNGLTRPPTGEQRGDPSENDSFFSSVLRFGWRLNDSNSPNGRAARQLRCPSFY